MLEQNQEDLDFFILHSSIVALLGNPGQATYGAANAFLDSFAEYRMKVLGKPCTAVCWGAMGGGGLLQRSKNVAQMIENSGMHLLDIPTGMFEPFCGLIDSFFYSFKKQQDIKNNKIN